MSRLAWPLALPFSHPHSIWGDCSRTELRRLALCSPRALEQSCMQSGYPIKMLGMGKQYPHGVHNRVPGDRGILVSRVWEQTESTRHL